MEFKGTQGKWKCFKNADYWVVSDMTGASVVIQSKSSCSSPFHAEANALLISKAPEMFETLEKTVVVLKMLSLIDKSKICENQINKIEKLIKEATEL